MLITLFTDFYEMAGFNFPSTLSTFIPILWDDYNHECLNFFTLFC